MRLALGLVLALIAAAPAGAQQGASERFPADVATPDGPATLYPHWTGPSTADCKGDRAIVSFTVRVGPGSRAGRVRLSIVRTDRDVLTGVRIGPWVELPAAPGDHRFVSSVHQGSCTTREEVALEQESGGHVIVHQHPPGNGELDNDFSKLHELWLFQPPLADGATGGPTERRQAHDLLMTWEVEGDGDRDGLGDATQDPTPPQPIPPGPPPAAPTQPEPPVQQAPLALGGPDRQRALRRGAVLVSLWSRDGGRARVSVRVAPGVTLRRTLSLTAGRETHVRVRLTAAARRAVRARRRTATVTATIAGARSISWRTRLLP